MILTAEREQRRQAANIDSRCSRLNRAVGSNPRRHVCHWFWQCCSCWLHALLDRHAMTERFARIRLCNSWHHDSHTLRKHRGLTQRALAAWVEHTAIELGGAISPCGRSCRLCCLAGPLNGHAAVGTTAGVVPSLRNFDKSTIVDLSSFVKQYLFRLFCSSISRKTITKYIKFIQHPLNTNLYLFQAMSIAVLL